MTSTYASHLPQAPHPPAERAYHRALLALGNAEDLRDHLVPFAQARPWNDYAATAAADAELLVAELERRLEDVQDRWTPEQIGIEP